MAAGLPALCARAGLGVSPARPGRGLDDRIAVAETRLAEQIRERIGREGYVVTGHFINDTLAMFYTVGLTAAGLPELACFGVVVDRDRRPMPLAEAAAKEILDTAARQMLEHGELMPGQRILGPGTDETLAIIDMEETSDLWMVRQIYGVVMAARQVIWPDPAGNFPWQMAWSLGPVQPMAGEPQF